MIEKGNVEDNRSRGWLLIQQIDQIKVITKYLIKLKKEEGIAEVGGMSDGYTKKLYYSRTIIDNNLGPCISEDYFA